MTEDGGTRDYAAEIRALIEAETAHGDFVTTEVAQRIVDKLRATDPDLLLGWLEDEAVRILTELIGDLGRMAKMRARRSVAPRSVFAGAMSEHGEGRSRALVSWLATTYETRDGVRRHLGDCNADDLEYNIERHRSRAKSEQYEAAWLAAIKKKIGNDTVADHFTDEQLRAMRK